MESVQRWEILQESRSAEGPFSVVCPDGEVYVIDDKHPNGTPDRDASIRRDFRVLEIYREISDLW